MTTTHTGDELARELRELADDEGPRKLWPRQRRIVLDALAALKASPTTEPNPNEGMQVAELMREARLYVYNDTLNTPEYLSDRPHNLLARIDAALSLTSASNPFLTIEGE